MTLQDEAQADAERIAEEAKASTGMTLSELAQRAFEYAEDATTELDALAVIEAGDTALAREQRIAVARAWDLLRRATQDCERILARR